MQDRKCKVSKVFSVRTPSGHKARDSRRRPSVIAAFLCGLGGGCGDAENNGGDDPQIAEMCTFNDGDGRTQCGSNVCEAGERCTQSGLIQCLPGCLDALNCGPQQWCDLRTADPGEAGLCRPSDDPACGGSPEPSSESGAPGDTAAEAECPDVQGNYRLTLSASSPDECQEILASGSQCSVSQDVCDITWGCDGEYATLLVPGAVGMSGGYETEGTFMGFAYRCQITFNGSMSSDLTWNCSIGQSGQAVLCEGTGSQ